MLEAGGHIRRVPIERRRRPKRKEGWPARHVPCRRHGQAPARTARTGSGIAEAGRKQLSCLVSCHSGQRRSQVRHCLIAPAPVDSIVASPVLITGCDDKRAKRTVDSTQSLTSGPPSTLAVWRVCVDTSLERTARVLPSSAPTHIVTSYTGRCGCVVGTPPPYLPRTA